MLSARRKTDDYEKLLLAEWQAASTYLIANENRSMTIKGFAITLAAGVAAVGFKTSVPSAASMIIILFFTYPLWRLDALGAFIKEQRRERVQEIESYFADAGPMPPPLQAETDANKRFAGDAKNEKELRRRIREHGKSEMGNPWVALPYLPIMVLALLGLVWSAWPLLPRILVIVR